ncbi:MAG: DUF6364 family protein [Spirochaetes bacterium]|nr:DUF6364 family protein [Spirochaetota bacterium]
MGKTLTLNIDQTVFEKAEIYAKRTKKTVPQLVEEYLSSISSKNKGDDIQLEPITSQLAGIIDLDESINHKEILADTLTERYI